VLKLKQLICIGFLFLGLEAWASDSLACQGKYGIDKLKNGIWICRSGKIVRKKEHYKNGVLVSYILFNEKGQMVETKNRKGKIKKFNPCGC
jgi:hypothetical protein